MGGRKREMNETTSTLQEDRQCIVCEHQRNGRVGQKEEEGGGRREGKREGGRKERSKAERKKGEIGGSREGRGSNQSLCIIITSLSPTA